MSIPLDEFWADVVSMLIERHGFSESQALSAVNQRRNELESHGITDLIAHWDVEEIAKSISDLI